MAFVVHEGRLLLVRRVNEPWAGRWDVPGGFCNEREHPIAAAEREVFEESGIRVTVTGYIGAWHETHEDPELPSGLVKTTLGHCYHAVPVGDTTPRLSDETTDARWFSADELPEDLAFPEQLIPAIAAWREAIAEGRTVTALPDRPA